MLSLPLAALWQQKSRTALTMLGVVFGSFVLAASLSIDQGVQDTFERETHRTDLLREVRVFVPYGAAPQDASKEELPVPGQMSDARRKRIRRALLERKSRFSNSGRVVFNEEKLHAMAALPHVVAAVPQIWTNGTAIVDGHEQNASVAAVRPESDYHRRRLVAGRFVSSPNEHAAVITEFLAYRWGIADEDKVQLLLGKKLHFEVRGFPQQGGIAVFLIHPEGGEPSRLEAAVLDKLKQQFPKVLDKFDLTSQEKKVFRDVFQGGAPASPSLYTVDYEIVGVVRLPEDEDKNDGWDPLRFDGDILLPFQTATDLHFHVPGQRESGLNDAVLLVDHESHVEEVLQAVRGMGLNCQAPMEGIKHERLTYLLIFGGMTCVAAVALFVAALGIANTMLMSVLERTREIGIMKAVGASNGAIQFTFLVEGALIGVAGGGLGLLLAWAASYPGDAWVRGMVSRDVKIELKEAIFVFPVWIALVVLVFAVLVTTLAALYPARRASRVDPVAALRHE